MERANDFPIGTTLTHKPTGHEVEITDIRQATPTTYTVTLTDKVTGETTDLGLTALVTSEDYELACS